MGGGGRHASANRACRQKEVPAAGRYASSGQWALVQCLGVWKARGAAVRVWWAGAQERAGACHIRAARACKHTNEVGAGMGRRSWLDSIVYRFQHHWETNPQYRAAVSGVVGLVLILSLC